MDLGERIKTILTELNIKQVEFAKTLGISANYVNLLANSKKTVISEHLAKLIEETYGYSYEWILYEKGEKKFNNGPNSKILSELFKVASELSENEQLYLLDIVKSLKERLGSKEK